MVALLIILKVLKIIGIVLLCVLGVVLFLLALVLFVPIRYSAKGSFNGEKPVLKGKAAWLFGILFLSFDINRDEKLSFRIFGFKKHKEKKVKKKDSKTDSYYDDDELEKYNEQEKNDEPVKEDVSDVKLEVKTKTKEIEYAPEEENETVQNDSIYVKIKKYIELIQTERFKKAYSLTKGKIKKLLKHVLPRRWNITCDYAFEDPATTGSVLGFASALYPFISTHINISTDFGKPHIDAKGYAKGHICIARVLILLGMVYFNRDIRKIIRLIKEV